MPHTTDVSNSPCKTAWTAPRFACLDVDMRNIENGSAPGNDGAGGSNTSLIS